MSALTITWKDVTITVDDDNHAEAIAAPMFAKLLLGVRSTPAPITGAVRRPGVAVKRRRTAAAWLPAHTAELVIELMKGKTVGQVARSHGRAWSRTERAIEDHAKHGRTGVLSRGRNGERALWVESGPARRLDSPRRKHYRIADAKGAIREVDAVTFLEMFSHNWKS